MIMKTFSLKKENTERKWYVVDASDKVLGRLSTKIADRIRGKDKPTFTPHTDGGDYVIVINAEKIKVTGAKYMNEKFPERIIEEAVKGMLPKNKLGKSMIKKLKVFSGPEHDHKSQQPIEWNPAI
jgi:large subunit ribosomal protein L13